MGFSDCFSSCMSPLPVPNVDGLNEALEFLHKLHDAWENAGGNEELLLSGLVAAGAVTGIDEAALAAAGGVTVLAYIALCVGCAAGCAGASIWDAIASSDTPDWLQSELTTAANDKGISKPDAVA